MDARITAYKGQIICELLATASSATVTTTLDNPGVFGQVIVDSKNNVGISKEAHDLLKTIKRGRDDLGELDWFKTSDNAHAFAWIGGPYTIVNPTTCESSSSYVANDDYTLIENEPPQGAMDYIDSK